jgi:hypothetical protein
MKFATKPRPLGDWGLCEATVAWVSAEKDADDPIATLTVYKAVSSLRPTKDNEAALAPDCRLAGRVIPTESADFGQVGFFSLTYPDGLRAWYAARSMEVAIEAFRKNPSRAACDDTGRLDGPAGRCVAAALPTSALRMDRLLSLSMERCVAGPSNCYTIEGEFLRSAEYNTRNLWVLRADAYLENKPRPDDVQSVANLKLTSSYLITD